MQKLGATFSIKDLGDLTYFLGVEVSRSSTGLFLSQAKYVRDILYKTKMFDAKSVTSPMATSPSLSISAGTSLSDPTEYRSVVGSLQYLSLTHPDIAFCVNRLAQFMHKPTTDHWTAVKRVLRYLNGSQDHGLYLRHHSPLRLHVFSDADWAGNPDDRSSTSAYVAFLGANPTAWSSKKQSGISRSSTEAEYRAVASAAAELTWLQSLLQELHVKLPASPAPTIYCDNIGATYLCANPVFHSRMKHIALDYHFVRDQVQKGVLRVSHVSTADQLADGLTKPLSGSRLRQLFDKIGVLPSSVLRGRVENVSHG